ncbi:MAG: ABC transporter permease [Ignavibacteriales bacterium]|nr:MAG: ABC transporter permease [Ignavibacteriales bacterium]
MQVNKILTIARWELIEKIKTKSFFISIIITPLIIIALTIVPTLLIEQEPDSTKVFGLIDTTGLFFESMGTELDQYKIDNKQPCYLLVNLSEPGKSIEELKRKNDSVVIKGNLDGVLAVTQKRDRYEFEYRSMNPGNIRDTKRFEKAFNNTRLRNNLTSIGINPDEMESLITDTELKEIKLDKSGKETETGFLELFFTSLIFIMILVFVILSSGGMLIRSVVEEKSNRLIEIIVSSCTPEELLTGKIIGLSALALLQIVIWILIGITLTGSNLIPESAFNNILPMTIYFILGFIFYTAFFVGIGSIVNTEQEAQQVTGYLSMLLLLPVIFSITTIENPDSGLVKVLTYIPFTAPAVMLLKLNIKPVPLHEILLTMSILLLSILMIIYITARIFRIGILSYGKVPTLKQLVHWIREK